VSMTNPTNQIEIITSVQRRRRWAASEKVRMVEAPPCCAGRPDQKREFAIAWQMYLVAGLSYVLDLATQSLHFGASISPHKASNTSR
jgi:hypothetical protein